MMIISIDSLINRLERKLNAKKMVMALCRTPSEKQAYADEIEMLEATIYYLIKLLTTTNNDKRAI